VNPNPFMFHSEFCGVWLVITRGSHWFKSFTSCNVLLHTTYNLVHSMQTNRLALEHFRALKTEKPRSKIAFFRGLYPEIVATLSVGHTLRDIHKRLVEDGIAISYPLLRNYINRIRRERSRSPFVQKRPAPTLPVALERTPAATEDPLANAMKALSKPRYDIRQAMCDGDPTKKKLI
jgi:hypothetical protein